MAEKPTMSAEERMALSEKLDQDLDEFISSLERKSYTEGWPEDRWQEEMEKHPFFMTKLPAEGEPLPPLLAGIQQLKYDTAENTAEELAMNYKEDGNFNFKHGNYRLAVLSYSEGLRAKCQNDTLNAELHNNRAAANFFLKNYRSCLMDCKAALALSPSYAKALRRAAKCCQHMGRLDQCVEFCDQGIQLADGKDKELLELRCHAIKQKKIQDRDSRKSSAAEKIEKQVTSKLIATIKDRGINIKGWKGGGELELSALEPCFPAAAHTPVSLDSEQRLVWPVLMLYPHYGVTDLIQAFQEDTTFEAHLNELFPSGSRAEWDSDGLFTNPQDLNVYFESEGKGEVVAVQKMATLGEILKDKRYCVYSGTPSFLVVVKESAAEKRIKTSL